MENNLIQPLIAAIISAAIAARSYRKKSLDFSGAISGFAVMTIHIAVNYRFGAVLLVFFFTSSMFTKFGEDKRQKVDADFKEGDQRNCYLQVISVFRRRLLTGVSAASLLAVGANFVGVTSFLLGFSPEAARNLKLDALYPV